MPTFLMSPSHIPRVARPTLMIVPRPSSSCHPPTSHVSPDQPSSLYHAHLPRVTLPRPTCPTAHLHYCTTPTFLVSPSHIPRVARPTFIIVPLLPSSCHPPTSHVSHGLPSSLYHVHLPRVTFPHPTCLPAHLHDCTTRPPSSCHPPTPHVSAGPPSTL